MTHSIPTTIYDDGRETMTVIDDELQGQTQSYQVTWSSEKEMKDWLKKNDFSLIGWDKINVS